MTDAGAGPALAGPPLAGPLFALDDEITAKRDYRRKTQLSQHSTGSELSLWVALRNPKAKPLPAQLPEARMLPLMSEIRRRSVGDSSEMRRRCVGDPSEIRIAR